MPEPLEKVVERHLLRRCREHGLLCLKLNSPGRRGVPDRLIVGPRATVFAELKRPGQKPRRLQTEMHKKIREAGGTVFVIDNEHDVDELVQRLATTVDTDAMGV